MSWQESKDHEKKEEIRDISSIGPYKTESMPEDLCKR
jgi:hypothetical protein